MFTVVPRPEIIDFRDQRPASGEPVPQVIDHRKEKHTSRQKWLSGHKNDQQTYESIKEQRDNLIQSEFTYKKRIRELEKEKDDLLEVYEPTYKENKQLKGHLLHGPDAQKIKKLKQEKKELMSELDMIKEENFELIDRVKELEKMFMSERDYYLEKKWREAVERGRKRREENDAVSSTQGPFANAGKPKKRDLKTVKDEEFEKQDEFDLHIDNLEKETQILLNKIRNIKQNKESISYAKFIGKGAITRNTTIAKAIKEKLERDMVTFEDRLEYLRKKARKLNIDFAEEILIPEKKLKTKQTGTKYFRTRHTQTDIHVKQNSPENQNNDTNKNKEQHFSSKELVARGPKSDSNKNKKWAIASTPTEESHLEPRKASTNHNSNKDIVIESNEEPINRTRVIIQTAGNVSHTLKESKGYASPISEHWNHLATKLNETEKNGTKKQLTHRDKFTHFKEYEQISARTRNAQRQIIFQQDKPPEMQSHTTTKNKTSKTNTTSIENESHSALSQRSTATTDSHSLLKIYSQNRDEISRTYDQKSDRDVGFKVNDMPDIEKSKKTADSLRKTTNMGVVIRYIPRLHSLEMGRSVKYTGDQMGRYSNGPEPIRRHNRKPHQKVNVNANDIRLKNENKRLNRESIIDTELRKESGVYRDVYSEARGASSDDEYSYPRNISAYDEVLADVQKQYKDQAQKQMLESKVKHESEVKTTRQSEKNYEHGVKGTTKTTEFQSGDRAMNKKEQRDIIENITGNNGTKREKVYKLDLL